MGFSEHLLTKLFHNYLTVQQKKFFCPRNVWRQSALACFLGFFASGAHALDINVGYLQWQPHQGPVLSNVFPEPEDSGLRGAELAIEDNLTSGQFLGHDYPLTTYVAEEEADLLDAFEEMQEQDIDLFVANVPASTLIAMADRLDEGQMLFNAGARDDHLRGSQCHPQVLHTQPSYAMLTDALVQWLKLRRWDDVLMITGPTPQDQAYAEAFRQSVAKFNITLVEEKEWRFDTDIRRTASSELPRFTQSKDYDVVVVADERGDFGEYVPYNTWLPRPVAGTQGLMPVTWHPSIEAWGAVQLQNRFRDHADRSMTGDDYAAWAAIRAIGEAVTRSGESQAPRLYDYLFSDDFELGAHKGRKLSFREWNGQLRQPIALVHPRALVAQAPFEGYLHQHTDLDTLGQDAPQSECSIEAR